MRSVSSNDFKFGVVFQASSGVGGAVGILKFSRVFHESYAKFMLVDEALTYEALHCSTVKKSDISGLFLCGV